MSVEALEPTTQPPGCGDWKADAIDPHLRPVVDLCRSLGLRTYASCSAVPSDHEGRCVFADPTSDEVVVVGYLAIHNDRDDLVALAREWAGPETSVLLWEANGAPMLSLQWECRAESEEQLEQLAVDAVMRLGAWVNRVPIDGPFHIHKSGARCVIEDCKRARRVAPTWPGLQAVEDRPGWWVPA